MEILSARIAAFMPRGRLTEFGHSESLSQNSNSAYRTSSTSDSLPPIRYNIIFIK